MTPNPTNQLSPASEGKATSPASLVGDLLTGGAKTQHNKTQALAEIISSSPDLITPKPSHALLLRLLLFAQDGQIIGTMESISESLHLDIPLKTLRNWIKDLSDGGFIQKSNQGKYIEITLTEPYRRIAKAPEVIVETTPTVIVNNTPEENDDENPLISEVIRQLKQGSAKGNISFNLTL